MGPFLLVADSVDMLRQLAMQFAEPEPIIEIKGKKEKVSYHHLKNENRLNVWSCLID